MYHFVGCRGRVDKSTELKLWCFCSAECGFESRSWHLCPWARHLTMIASLHPGVNGYLWGQSWFLWLISLWLHYIFGGTGCILPRELRWFKEWFKAKWPGVIMLKCHERHIRSHYYYYYYNYYMPIRIRPYMEILSVSLYELPEENARFVLPANANTMRIWREFEVTTQRYSQEIWAQLNPCELFSANKCDVNIRIAFAIAGSMNQAKGCFILASFVNVASPVTVPHVIVCVFCVCFLLGTTR